MARGRSLGAAVALAALLRGGAALACSIACSGGPFAFWPSEASDVPRLVHPLVLWAPGMRDDNVRLQLFDAGPMRPTDGLTEESWKNWRPVPADVREVSVELRQVFRGPGWTAYEVRPTEAPLAANHRFLLAMDWHIQAAFATGSRLEIDAPVPALALRADRLIGPIKDPICPPNGAGAQFRVSGAASQRRLLAVWMEDDETGPPAAFAEVAHNKVELAVTSPCGGFGVSLGSGTTSLVVREWTVAGIGPPMRVEFRLP